MSKLKKFHFLNSIDNYEVREDIFDTIVDTFSNRLLVLTDKNEFNKYLSFKHARNHKVLPYDGKEYLICPENMVDYYAGGIKDPTSWKWCRIRRVKNMSNSIKKVMTGNKALHALVSLLEPWYNDDSIDKILSSYSTPYDDYLKQYKVYSNFGTRVLSGFSNCYSYDINGAHCDALCEMFPLAKEAITKLYRGRKKNPENKGIANFAVGMFKHMGYEGAYNWIVQRTTKKLYEAIDYCGGMLLHVNTDGFTVHNPERLLTPSTELGEFKLKYSGDVYIYQDKNYWLMQTDEMTGTCRVCVRPLINLKEGKVVHYKAKKVTKKDSKGNEYIVEEIQDITEEIVDVSY